MTGMSIGKPQMGLGSKHIKEPGMYAQTGYNNFTHGNNGSQVRNSNVNNTPGTAGTSKMGIKKKQKKEDEDTIHHAGNMQQPTG